MKTATKRSPGRPPMNESLTARRQEEILDAAAKIFAKQGYPNTDLQVVADELGVAKGTLYRYFPSKKDLFLTAVDRVVRRLHQTLDAVEGTEVNPVDGIATFLRTYFAFLDANPEFVELLIQERAEFKDRGKPTYFQHREEKIEDCHQKIKEIISAGFLRQMPAERLTDVIGNLVYGAMFTNYFSGRKKSLESQTDDILDIVFYGILSESERERLIETGRSNERRK